MKWGMLFVLFVASAARAAVVAVPGYAVRTIPTPDTATGGVVRRGDAILVGQGSFGAGGESVIRLDGDGGATTIATGFNALGGFDLDATGTLFVSDNCKECPGASTGDTVFAIPDALTRSDAVAALGAEVVPAGTLPYAANVLAAPDGTLLVGDAAGPGAGRVVKIVGATPSDLITSLDYVGGLAITSTMTLLVGNVDGSFVGSVLKYALDGTASGTLVGGLPGEYAHALDSDGLLLVTGEYSFDCSGQLRAVAADGSVAERAHGFCFSADVFFDTARDEALVLDGGASGADAKQIVAICRDQDGDGVCDVDDDCPLDADADQADTDGDGLGDACDPCTGATIAKQKLTIGKLLTPTGDDTLAFTGAMTLPTTPALDPVTAGARVLVEGVIDATIPGGAYDSTTKTGWKTGKNGSFTYKNGSGGVSGIVRLALKGSKKVPGTIKFAVVGKKGSYPVDPAHLPSQATLILDAAAGQCGDAHFPGPPPAPACVYKPKSGKVQCK
jgi:hypothetical protein